MATTVIQDNVRIFSNVADWDWYRLLCLVRPLIPKDREKLRIEELEKMIQKLEEENQKTLNENEILNRVNICCVLLIFIQKMTKLEEEHLRELAKLRKEKMEMEEKLRRVGLWDIFYNNYCSKLKIQPRSIARRLFI